MADFPQKLNSRTILAIGGLSPLVFIFAGMLDMQLSDAASNAAELSSVTQERLVEVNASSTLSASLGGLQSRSLSQLRHGSLDVAQEFPNPETTSDAEQAEPISNLGDIDSAETSVEEPGSDILEELQPAPRDDEAGDDIDTGEAPPEVQVLIAEVQVNGLEERPELENLVYEKIQTRPDQTTTRSQLQSDINAVFDTGFFTNVQSLPEDTSSGVRVTLIVEPNPILREVDIVGSQLADQDITLTFEGEELEIEQLADAIFESQYGTTLNLLAFQEGINQLSDVYEENGYVLAQVLDAQQVSDSGVAVLEVAEGVIEDIEIKFLDEDGLDVNQDGEPVEGWTRDFVIFREFKTESGDVFNQPIVQDDLEQIFELGIFDDIRVTLEPGDDPRNVDVVVNVIERNTASFAAGLGFSSSLGTFGNVEVENSNYEGRGQSFTFETELSISKISFAASFESLGPTRRFRSSLNAVQNSGLSALSRLEGGSEFEGNESYDPAVVEQLLDTFALAEEEGNFAEAALTLNNLANYYASTQNSQLAIETYLNSLEYFQVLNSSAMQLLTLLQLAKQYKVSGQSIQALNSYYNALEVINILENETSFEVALGSYVFEVLQTEWQINDQQVGEYIAFISDLLELTVLLDIGAIYAATGNYQQALYIAESPRLSENIQSLNSDVLELSRLIEAVSEDGQSNELGDFVKPVVVLLGDNIESLIQEFPAFARLLSLEIIYSGLYEASLADIYQAQSQREFDALKNLILSFPRNILSELPQLIDERTRFLGAEGPEFEIALERLAELLGKWVDIKLGDSESDSLPSSIQDSIAEDLELQTDELVNLLVRSDSLTESDLMLFDEIEPLLKALIPAVLNYVESQEEENSGLALEAAQSLLLNWPGNSQILRELEWLKGFLYVAEGNAYHELGRYEEATSSYGSAITYLQIGSTKLGKISESISADQTVTAESISSDGEEALAEFEQSIRRSEFSARIQSNTLSGFLDQFSAIFLEFVEPFLPFIEEFTNLELLRSYLRAAESYFELGNPLEAKRTYQSALIFNDELPSNFSSPLVQAEIAEVYYGIALSESMLGNLKDAQQSIESAIEISESFFPEETISGDDSFTPHASILYGYGVPYRGKLYLNFGISSINPFRTPQLQQQAPSGQLDESSELLSASLAMADDHLSSPFTPADYPMAAVDSTCKTPASYFVCRQNYFEVYIDLLSQQHTELPSNSFDVLAFEQSERARVHTPQIFQTLDNSDLLSPEQERLQQRRLLLNEPASLSEIKSEALDENTLLLEYFLGHEKSYLWLVSQDGPLQTFELPARSVIEDKAREFYTLLTEPSGRVRPENTAAVGQELSEMILGPIANQLDRQRLLIVGDGFLQYLPFNVLPNPTPQAEVSESSQVGEFAPHLQPLLLEHEIVALPSASALVALRRDRFNKDTPSQELAVFANPVFNHEDDRAATVTLGNGLPSLGFRILEDVDVLYSALPNTAEELSSIETLIPPTERQTFSGYDANLKTALSSDIGQFRIVHFASHGVFDSQAPERSGIVLSSFDEEGALQPGLLSPTNAFNDLNLSATDLVVLSGCRTGIGPGEVVREGLTGFTGGLLSAGTDRVVASLWSVQDEATKELMSRFYERLLDTDQPMTAAEALRAAQISMWNEPRWQTPYYWAAFVIQGEWN